MAVRKRKPVEANDGSYEGRVLAAFDATQLVDQKIDQLLHDAEHAVSGAVFAARIGHVVPADQMHQKARRLKAEAEALYLDNPGSKWPECEWPAPTRKSDSTK